MQIVFLKLMEKTSTKLSQLLTKKTFLVASCASTLLKVVLDKISSLLKLMQKLGGLLYQALMKIKVFKIVRESFEDGLQSLANEIIETIKKI